MKKRRKQQKAEKGTKPSPKVGSSSKNKLLIGFVGNGFVGKNHADDYERRGFNIVRCSLDKEHRKNRPLIKRCDVVFIAVPTPTTPEGFDYSIVREAINLAGKNKIVVIKSTILPGVTAMLQNEYPDRIIMHAPEFLSEVTAAREAAFPARNIIGITRNTKLHKDAARLVLSTLPRAPYSKICSSQDAELIKYGRNTLGYVRIVYANILYDLAQKLGADWDAIQEAMSADPETGPTYMKPLHKSGRGAGGHCFIKDFAAFKEFFRRNMRDKASQDILDALEYKNLQLLLSTEKDLDLLEGVYGKSIFEGI